MSEIPPSGELGPEIHELQRECYSSKNVVAEDEIILSDEIFI